MTFIKRITAASTVCALMGSTAIADVTAEEVWEGIQSYYNVMGYQVATTNVTKDGNKLIVDNFALSFDIPDEDETIKVSGISMVFEELANGTVALQIPEELTISAEVEDVVVDLLLTTQDLNLIASGDPKDVTYDMSAASYAIELKQIREGDVAFLPTAIATLYDIKGGMRVSMADMTSFAYDFTSSKMDLNVDVQEPETDNSFKALITLDGLTVDSTSKVPNDVDMEQISDALANGMVADGKLGYTGATFDISVVDGQDGADIKGSSQSGNVGFTMSAEGIGYNTASANTEMTVVPAMMPLPINLSIAETASEFLFPVSKSDSPQDARVMMKYAGVSIDEALWGMFDPGAVLPRTPATILLDLSAKLSWDMNVLDPESMEDFEGTSFPGKLYSATINDIQVAAAGAEFTGDGAFTFNNDDLETFDGLPAPDGAINLNLKGGNGLLDKLIQMGFVKEEDALGIRMMSGLFANAGAGEDELVSKIEVKPNGNVIANGQRIK